MNSLQQGWFTFDNANAFSHVLMPYGFSVGLGFSLQKDGKMIAAPQALVGYRGADEPHLHPESRSFDGTYTGMRMEWLGNEILVETADDAGNLYMKVTPVCLKTPMKVYFYGKMLWSREGILDHHADGFTATVQDSEGVKTTWFAAGYGENAQEIATLQETLKQERNGWGSEQDTLQMPQSHLPQMLLTDHMLAFDLNDAVYFSVEKNAHADCSAADAKTEGVLKESNEKRACIQRKIEQGKQAVAAEKAAYGAYGDAYDALRTVVAWDTIYVEETNRICTPVSRIWNNNWGGYVLFCWDTYFAALMSMLGSIPAACWIHDGTGNVQEIQKQRFLGKSL